MAAPSPTEATDVESKQAATAAASARRLPFGWSLKTDATGVSFFQSTAGRAEYDLTAELSPVFAEPSVGDGSTVITWVRFVCAAADKSSAYYFHSYTGEIVFECPRCTTNRRRRKAIYRCQLS